MNETPAAPEVLTLGQFMARGGYDSEISHDRLRFPHGISKTQERSNRKAANHNLAEAIRGMQDYAAAVAAGTVRPPTENERVAVAIFGHPDHESTKATWRVIVKRALRLNPDKNDLQAVADIVTARMEGIDPWVETLGLPVDASLEAIVEARIRWMQPTPAILAS